MIERFYLKQFLSFDELELNLDNGLIVFSGPSGSGKSILMSSILASLGLANCEASLCESTVSWRLDEDNVGIENDEVNVFKHIKKEKSRYFINNQTVSKKSISQIALGHVKHLSLKDFSDFENHNLLEMIDNRIQSRSKDIDSIKYEYKDAYIQCVEAKKELEKILEEEKSISELKEFARFEIDKIESVNPTPSEDEELLKIKKELSQKEKSMEKIELAKEMFNFEHYVSDALDALDVDSSFFDDSMNELRSILDSAEDRFSSLENVDIEEVLNRIEELSALKRRYGSIEESLEYKENKKQELAKYENIEFTKSDLQNQVKVLDKRVDELAQSISKLRTEELISFEQDLNHYLQRLYLRDAQVSLEESDLGVLGRDSVTIKLNATDIQKVSTGEFNRMRLAILALKSEFMTGNGGVLILDEIDANLSGEESMSVAKVLKKLSKHFQIYVISHQPQLTSMGDQHFLVYKDGENSKVKELDNVGKINEIARIISGNNISAEAKKFAKELIDDNRCSA